MATERHKRIAELMSGLCKDREFTPFEVSIIESCIDKIKIFRSEHKKTVYEARSKKGKLRFNKDIAEAVNARMSSKNPMTAEHILLYKHCWADEYEERTGKCIFGYKDLLISRGYDPVTREEVV